MSARKETYIRVEVDDKTPSEDDFSVVVFQNTVVPQRPPKSPLTVGTAWKVFRGMHGRPVAFNYPTATGLEAEIAIPETPDVVRVKQDDVPLGSKWLLVETTSTEDETVGEEPNGDEAVGEEPAPTFVFREVAVPSKPPRHSERIPKNATRIENQLNEEESGPSLQRLSITKGGTPIQTIKGVSLPPKSAITFCLQPILHFGLAAEVEEGDTFNKALPLTAYYSVSLEDFPRGIRVEVNKGSTGDCYFTAHSQLTGLPPPETTKSEEKKETNPNQTDSTS